MNSITQQNRIAYNYLAKAYANEWANKPDKQLADSFISYLSPSAKILDVGCGPGQYSQYFYGCGFDVIGIDFSEEMIAIAREQCSGIDFVLQDMRELDFENNSFDALWVCSSFVHIPVEDSMKVLNEFGRVLKKPGILFINAIVGELPYRLETEEEIGGQFRGNGRYFQWYPSASSFVELLNIASFSVECTSTKTVTSAVVKNATVKTNEWFNYICKIT